MLELWQASNQSPGPIRASRIGGEYDPDGSDPVLVIRDEHGVLRAVSSYTPLKGNFVRGNLKGYGDMLELKLEAEQC